jgi:hypothetical protein
MDEKMITETRELFDFLYLSIHHLTTGQMNLIASMKKQFRRNGELSEKQFEVLREIKKYLPIQEVRMTNKIMEMGL